MEMPSNHVLIITFGLTLILVGFVGFTYSKGVALILLLGVGTWIAIFWKILNSLLKKEQPEEKSSS